MEAREGDELEGVAHRRQLALESGDGLVVEVPAPVERRRAVVRQLLAGELGVHGLGEPAREFEVRLGRLHPEQVGVRRVGEAAGDDRLDAVPHLVEPLSGAGAGEERAVALVMVAREQCRREGVGAGDDDGRHSGDVGSEPGGVEGADVLAGRDEHLAAHVAALLLARQLVLPVHTGGTGLDHAVHQLVGVERAAEAGLGVGDDRGHPVADRTVHALDLAGAQ